MSSLVREVDYYKVDIELNSNKKNYSFLLLYLGIIIFCVILWSAYYKDFINSFMYVGTLLVSATILLVFLLIFRKDKNRIGKLTLITITFVLFLCYEFKLLEYEPHTYTASFHAPPVEAYDDSGINLMIVRTIEHAYVEDREMIVRGLEQQNLDVIDLYKVNNKSRYNSKNAELLRLFRIQKDDFTIMSSNVKRYLEDDLSGIDQFLNRKDISGDSAGLGIALTGLIAQGQLKNNLTFGVTGAILATGEVKAIGMIKEKVLIAEKENFPFMIIPTENANVANEVKIAHNLNVEIFDVDHIDQAILLIQELNDEYSR